LYQSRFIFKFQLANMFAVFGTGSSIFLIFVDE